MPRFLIKATRDRDAYLEWSTIVDAPVSIGTRAGYVTQYGEERLSRTDEHGTSAMYFDWLPGDQQQGGWADEALLIANIIPPEFPLGALLPRTRLGDLYDLLTKDVNATVPADWVTPFDDDQPDEEATAP